MPVLADELARLQAHRWQISDLSFSPDGTRLASAGWDKEVNIWELSNLERVLNLSDVHRVPVTSVSWLRPNGLLICTGSADRTAALWNAETGAHVASLTDHAGWVLDTDFSATGAFLATACWDHTVRIWDPGSEKVVNSLTGHGGGVWSVEFHPNSSQLCTASEDKSARIWDTRMNRPAGSLYGQHTDAVYCAAWSPDGSVIATGSADNKICIWEPRQQAVINTIYAHQDTVKSLAFNPHTDNVAVPVLASAGGDKLCLSDHRPSHRADILSVSLHKEGKEIEAVAVSPDGSLLVSGGRDGLVVLMTLMVPSIVPRSESHYTSLTSSVLRKSRVLRDRSYIYDATVDEDIPPELEEEEEEEDDELMASWQEEIDHFPAESKKTEKVTSYNRMKRRSRFDEKATELPDYATVRKKKVMSARTARERRAKGKSFDIPTMIAHLSAAARVYGPEEPDSSSESEEEQENKPPQPNRPSPDPKVDILSHIKAWSNPQNISSLPPPRRKISIEVTGRAKTHREFFEAGDSLTKHTIEEEESQEEELSSPHSQYEVGNSYRLEDLMTVNSDEWTTSPLTDPHFTPTLPTQPELGEEEEEAYSDDDTVSMI
ncbi:Uncharacterized WD repeat-containing protein alr3466 [Geodia barretti]|uniref:Uncharacterized WD repeat-containing protein alr3466 n=1 Tax=Geodia barretti TaxID=519541 RepID=A0AA35RPE8_GEOBA|nr:Uncharacterized WD repeat-containing protein alr3466 [Geodia barretti]